MLLIALLAACAGDIQGLYNAERDAVLTTLGPPSTKAWDPELDVRISEPALQRVTEAGLREGVGEFRKKLTVPNPLGVELSVTPKGQVRSVRVQTKKGCTGCLTVTAKVQGDARWEAGPLGGTVPFAATVSGQVRFEAVPAKKGWEITGKLVSVDRVEMDRTRAAKVDLKPVLGEWIEDALKKAEPMDLGHFGGAGLPLRALRLDSDADALHILGLVDAVGAVPVTGKAAPLTQDWDLRIHETTLAMLARREAFQLGMLEHDTAADPRALHLDGDRFTLDLRLWRLSGMGWWRDYTVDGTLALNPRTHKLSLKATDAKATEKSKGAAIADPLAFLAEGQLLGAVTGAVRASVPAATRAKVGGRALKAEALTAKGEGQHLVVIGRMTL